MLPTNNMSEIPDIPTVWRKNKKAKKSINYCNL